MRFTVKRKIIVGLAAILAIGIGSMLMIYYGLSAVARQIQELADVQEPVSAAAYEMEINVNGMGLAVLGYLDNRKPRYRAWVRNDQTDFERFHARYVELGGSADELELAQELDARYREFKDLGNALIRTEDVQGRVFARATVHIGNIDRIINRRLQPKADGRAIDAYAKISAVAQMETELAKLHLWLTSYRESGDQKHRARVVSRRAGFRRAVATFEDLDLTRDEARWTAKLKQEFAQATTAVEEMLALQESLARDIARFSDLRVELDRLLDEEVQILALQNLYMPRQQVDDTAASLLHTARFLMPLFVLSGVGIAVLFIRTLMGPLQALRDGTVAIGSGDLDHRILATGRDEFADLARQFNRMVVQLQVTTVSKELLEVSEEKLRETVANLRREISEREQAEQARSKLEAALRRSEAMSAMGALVAGVAHEVRNPLFAVSSTLDAMDARFKDRKDHKRYVDVLREEVDRLSKLMVDLLQYGKPTTAELVPGNIEDVVAQAVHACSPLAQQMRIEIAPCVQTDKACVLMDQARLAQVFQNLLENALQHSAPQTTLTIEARQVSDAEQRWIVCAVKDNGPGISEENLPRLFEPFFTRRRGGTGLGLSIVQRIVEEHGGQITASNRPEGGAVMEVRLPVAPP
ncbi:MAG: ATP-binding protein [Gammaproteobacteria bacterium]